MRDTEDRSTDGGDAEDVTDRTGTAEAMAVTSDYKILGQTDRDSGVAILEFL